MKQRIITGVVGLCLFFALLFLFDSFFFNIILAVVAMWSIFELLHAYKLEQHKLIMVASCVFAGVVPLVVNKSNAMASIILIIVYVTVLSLYALKNHEKVRIDMLGLTFFLTVVFTFSMMPFLYMRDQFGVTRGLFYTLLVFACSWGSDTGAYFAGRFLGKHKLAPKLSPNKTIEGVIGGVASCLIFTSLVTAAFVYYTGIENERFIINYLILALVVIIGSVIGVLGDLFASMIKRQCEIKDFGHIMPGHGGMVDRFDSTFFVAPFFFVVLQLVNIVA